MLFPTNINRRLSQKLVYKTIMLFYSVGILKFSCKGNFSFLVIFTYCRLSQWFSTFFKSQTPDLSNLLLRTPHKLTRFQFSAQNQVKSKKKKVITSSDDLFCIEYVGEELKKRVYPYNLLFTKNDYFLKYIIN